MWKKHLIEVHYLPVEEAKRVIADALACPTDLLKAWKSENIAPLMFISIGIGNHSKNGVAKLAPELKRYFKEDLGIPTIYDEITGNLFFILENPYSEE